MQNSLVGHLFLPANGLKVLVNAVTGKVGTRINMSG